MAKIHLEKTHPGLFKGILAIALTHLFVGGLIAYSLTQYLPHRPELAFFFVGSFFIVAFCIIYGLKAPHYKFVRRGLIAGLALITFLAIVFTLSVSLTLNQEQTIRLAWLVPPWALWAYMHVLCLEEPPSNPSSEVD